MDFISDSAADIQATANMMVKEPRFQYPPSPPVYSRHCIICEI